jgi:hypothetical protein
MRRKLLVAVLFMTVFSLTSCKKETIYTYGVDDTGVGLPGVEKPNLKSDLEFISIAYSDLFGNTIPSDELEDMALCYVSLGDKR